MYQIIKNVGETEIILGVYPTYHEAVALYERKSAEYAHVPGGCEVRHENETNRLARTANQWAA